MPERSRLRYRLLGTRRRVHARKVARQSYLLAGGDPDRAVEFARDTLRREYGFWESILVSLAIRLVIELVEWWFRKGIAKPPLDFQPGEPGA